MLLDRWWLDSMTDTDIWGTRFAAQLQIGVGVAAVILVVVGGSLWYVFRLGREGRFERSRAIVRYHERMGPAHRWLLLGILAYLVVHISLAATLQWRLWLLFRHGGHLGVDAPVVGGDLGAHLFRLPFFASASSFLRQIVLVTIVLSAFGHVTSGALRIGRGGLAASRAAVVHLLALTTLLVGLQAVHYLLVARPSMATNRVGAFDGPGYTERIIGMPAFVVLAVAAVIVAGVITLASRRERFRPAMVSLVLLGALHALLVWVVPAATERFVVAPAEAQRQLWSIDANLEATVAAFGLDRVEDDVLDVSTVADGPADDISVADGDVADGAADVGFAAPLLDTAMMVSATQVLAGTTGTRVVDVDVNRIEVDGEPRLAYLAARAASRPDVPESGWVQEHLVYTHGDGLVVSPATSVGPDGRPDVVSLRDEFDVLHDPLYFGERLDDWYVVVGTRRDQLDGAVFEGEGLDVGSFGSRLVLALAMGETEPVFTNELTSESQLLYRRSLRERVGALAPFLDLDGDPYPVVVDGRVTWILDGYTTSSTYPSAQFVTVSGVPGTSDLAGREINYLHPAVRATVDAETGETHLYRIDRGDDPILDVWADVFPGLLEAGDTFPDEMRDQVRYPDDLWTVQSGLIGRYHVDDAETLFNGTERWAVSAAAAVAVGEPSTDPSPTVDEFTRFDPLSESSTSGALGPGADASFGAVRPYGPGSASNPTSTRDELSAIVVAEHGVDRRILLVRVVSEDTSDLLSPQVAQSAIDADPDVAQVITLLNANGSKVQFGPMSPVPTDRGIVWTRPIIVIGTGTSPAPRLYGVAAVVDGEVAIGDSTQEAIGTLTGAS